MITKNDYTLETAEEHNSNINARPLHELFDEQVSANSEGVAFEDSGKSYKFREVQDYSIALSSWMLDNGITKGDIISLYMTSSTAFSIAHIAASRIGALISPLHMTYGKKELTELISFSGSKLLIADLSYSGKELYQKVKEVADSVHMDKILANVNEIPVLEGWESFWDVCRNHKHSNNYPTVMPSDPIGLFFTSGTETGEPKGCIHTHSSMMGNAMSVCIDSEIDRDSVIISGSAFSHLFGILSLHASLISGSKNVIVKRFNAEEFLRLAERSKPTHVFLVPTELRDIVNLVGKSYNPFTNAKEFRIAGAELPHDLAKEFITRINGNLVNHWGMTELGAGSYTRHSERPDMILGCIGQPVNGAHVAILSSESKLVVNEIGEILYRGPSLFKGYYKLPDYTKNCTIEINGEKWFRTGDLGLVDENGILRYMGRKKVTINRAGMKINSREVERILEGMKGIDAVCVVPVPDSRLGERACLFYSTYAQIGKEEITEYLNSKDVAKYKWPEYFVVENNMPRTPTGKIAKGKLAQTAKVMFDH